MSFYDEWLKCLREEHNDKQFLKAFLLSEDYTIQPLIEGDSEDIVTAIKLLLDYPLEKMLEAICSLELNYSLQPKDVHCFSNFQNGSARLVDVLMFFPNGLTFDDLGYQLMKSSTKGARVKYGENHAKLAESMNLVTISKDRPAIVQNTSLGKEITTIVDETKKTEILRKLVVRNKVIQEILCRTLQEKCDYISVVNCLSYKTAIRRSGNVKCIVKLVLTGTKYESTLKNIKWR